MRIESIHIHGFGCLVDRRYEFPEGRCALVVENNESGKSTLAAAILAGLCGLPSRRRTGEAVKLKDVYKPWGSDNYSIEMIIEVAGRRLGIERDFAKGSFIVRDAETNKNIGLDFSEDLAEQFLRLPVDDFRRVAFISGKEVHHFASSANLRDGLAALVDGSQEDSSADKAVAAIDAAGYTLAGRGVKIDTAVSRLEKSIEEKKRRMDALDSALDAAGDEASLLEEHRTRHKALSGRLSALDAEYRAARLAEVRERIASARASCEEVTGLERKLAELVPYAEFPAEKGTQLEKAAARLAGQRSELGILNAKLERLQRDYDGAVVRVEAAGQFASANEDDLMALGSGEDAIRSARDAVRAKQGDVELEKRALRAEGIDADPARQGNAPGRLASYGLVGVGVVCWLAAIALLALRRPASVTALGLVVAGALAACAGIVGILRSGARSARARSRSISLAALTAQLEQADGLLTAATDRALRQLARLGVECAAEDALDVLGSTKIRLQKHIEDRGVRRALELDLSSASREVALRQEAIRDEEKTIADILSDARIDSTLPLNEAMKRFEDAEKLYAHYKQVRDTLLPAARKHLLPEEGLARLTVEEAELASQGDTAVDGPARTSSEVEAERQSTRSNLDATNTAMTELEKSVGACLDTYRAEYADLREELETLESEMRKALRFGKALGIAREVLREATATAHRRWAAALNERASGILAHLNPDYDNLRFDDSLGFTIRRSSDQRIVEKTDVDACLSTGAKDQIYLSVRLACCQELSGLGESIPIILDDPLIAADDSRFRTGLRCLVEQIAPGNQLIVLSCHHSRHLTLRDEPWFAENVTLVEL